MSHYSGVTSPAPGRYRPPTVKSVFLSTLPGSCGRVAALHVCYPHRFTLRGSMFSAEGPGALSSVSGPFAGHACCVAAGIIKASGTVPVCVCYFFPLLTSPARSPSPCTCVYKSWGPDLYPQVARANAKGGTWVGQPSHLLWGVSGWAVPKAP